MEIRAVFPGELAAAQWPSNPARIDNPGNGYTATR
jgi:hypothetical protein